MILTDCHVHSLFSSDSDAPVEAMVEKAVSLGFDRFYLTDHMDYDFPVTDGYTFQFSPEDYFQRLKETRECFQGKIKILTGIELGLQPQKKTYEKINRLLNDYSFDLIIGSTHLVAGQDPYHAEYWRGKTEKEALVSYFEEILENIRLFPHFHVLGHLDYAMRYAPLTAEEFCCTDCLDIIDEILTFLIEHEIALEVNTGGCRSRLKRTNPGEEILKRYHNLGGRMISIGSDAHKPEDYGSYFKETGELLQRLGFSQYATFENGRPLFHPIR